jgi:transcriptional regulator GlxA family with amidase domain
MVLHFKDQVFRPDSLLNQPLVGLPFADSLVRGFLLATEHSHRRALATQEGLATPQAVRMAVDIIEADAHLPMTVSSIAARCHASVRALQEGFKRHLDTTPMAYLRDVRLRRAHHRLSELDPSTTSVSSIAYDLGFTNLGRFAAAYAARYGELPAVTLRRARSVRSAAHRG